jgi:hypothetical protein
MKVILLASVLGVVTNAQSLSMMMSLPTIELGSMSMEGIEFGAFATAAKSTKGPAAKAKAGKGTYGSVGGKGGKAAPCGAVDTGCTQDSQCCTGICASSKCACLINGSDCTKDYECCSGKCKNIVGDIFVKKCSI